MRLTPPLLSSRYVTHSPSEDLLRSVMEHVQTAAPAGTVVPIMASASLKASMPPNSSAHIRPLGFGIHLDGTLRPYDVSMQITAPNAMESTAKVLDSVGTLSDVIIAAHPELEAKLGGPMTVVALANSGLKFTNAQTRLDKVIYGTELAAGAFDAGARLAQLIGHINVPGAAELVLFAQLGAEVLAVYRDVTTEAQT